MVKDTRTQDDKIVDSTLGIESTSTIDHLADIAVDLARPVMGIGEHVIETLRLGQALDNYVMACMLAGAKRANAILRITERIAESCGTVHGSVLANQWIRAYHTVRLGIDGFTSIDALSTDQLEPLSFNCLRDLSVSLVLSESSGTYSIQEGWIDFLRSALTDSSLRGSKLRSAIADRKLAIEESQRQEKRSKLTPDQLAKYDASHNLTLQSKQTAKQAKACTEFASRAINDDISPIQIRSALAKADKLGSDKEQVFFLAEVLTPDLAVDLVDRLVVMGRIDVVKAIVSRSLAYASSASAEAAVPAAIAS